MIREMVQRIAPLDSNVLITGESGTGKELVADLIHYNSPRAAGPLVKINCAAIPETLLESELFGYERGAFTGAVTKKPGKFELADSGTILLDEIGDMPLNTQVKILRIVETKHVERLGGKEPIYFDARIICTTNQNLTELIEKGKFREDLYYRINVALLHLPALRERKEDIPLLVQHYLNELNMKLGLEINGLTPDAMELFLSYDWPGNVRELINVLEKSAILTNGPLIDKSSVNIALEKSVSLDIPKDSGQMISLSDTLKKVEKTLIVNALKQSKGIQIKAAKMLGLAPKNLWKKIKKHNIDVTSL
jgi:two-component system response regulator AtoC